MLDKIIVYIIDFQGRCHNAADLRQGRLFACLPVRPRTYLRVGKCPGGLLSYALQQVKVGDRVRITAIPSGRECPDYCTLRNQRDIDSRP